MTRAAPVLKTEQVSRRRATATMLLPVHPLPGPGNATDVLLRLQVAAGNRAVAGLVLQRKQTPTRPKLRLGSNGEVVREMQTLLNQSNFATSPIKVDGNFGRSTEQALRQFQRVNPPLQADGIAGARTWAELERSAATSKSGHGNAEEGAAAGKGAAQEAPPPQADQSKDKETAKALFFKGVGQADAGEHSHAYDSFTLSDELWHTKNATFNRGAMLNSIGGRAKEAIAFYERYLAEAPDGPRAADAAAGIAELKGRA